MFLKRKSDVEQQIKELQEVLDYINFKCWYYETACDSKSEESVKKLIPNNIPKKLKKLYDTFY